MPEKINDDLPRLVAEAFFEFLKNSASTEKRDRFLAYMEKLSRPTPLADEVKEIKAKLLPQIRDKHLSGGEEAPGPSEDESSAPNRPEGSDLAANNDDPLAQMSQAAPKEALENFERQFRDLAAENSMLAQELESARAECARLGRELVNAMSFEKHAADKLAEMERQLQSATDEIAGLEENGRQLEAAQKEIASIKLKNVDLGNELARSGNELADARRKLGRLEASSLDEQEKLRGLQDFLQKLSPQARKLLEPYFNPQSLAVFLAQCGQFNRLIQIWEACGKAVANGANAGDLAPMLLTMLDIYNGASFDAPASLVEANPGDPYKPDTQFRVNSDGTRVRRELLPGLRNAGGKLIQPALVELE